LAGTRPGSELRHEIAERAITIAESLRDLGQRSLVEEDGSEGLVASVERLGGMSEEAAAGCVVHGPAPETVTRFSSRTSLDDNAIPRRPGRLKEAR
jgi:hypothetical protein